MVKQDTLPNSSTSKNKYIMLAGGIIVIGLMIASIFWLVKPTYSVLLNSIPDQNRDQIIALISEKGVDYQIDEVTGSLLIPSDRLIEMRSELASSGLPTASTLGLEIFSDGDYGMSEFAQRINYQRGLEGELSRTIQSIAEVRHARVHLTIGKQSVFESRKEQAKASVFIQLRSNKALSTQQIFGIQQLVASAVPTLLPDQVSVLDDLGRSLTQSENVHSNERFISIREIEEDYESRVTQLISGIIKNSKYHVAVKIQINYDKVKTVSESILPQAGSSNGFLAKKREQIESAKPGAQPDSNSIQSSSSTDVEYFFGKQRSEIDQASGKIEKVDVAVVSDGFISIDAVNSIKLAIHAGLGLDDKRGDTIAVVGSSIETTSAINKPLSHEPELASSIEHVASNQSAAEEDYSPSEYALWIAAIATFSMFLFFFYRSYLKDRVNSLSQEQRTALVKEINAWIYKVNDEAK